MICVETIRKVRRLHRKRNEVLTHFLPRALAPALSDFPYRNRDKDFLHGVDDGVPPLVGR